MAVKRPWSSHSGYKHKHNYSKKLPKQAAWLSPRLCSCTPEWSNAFLLGNSPGGDGLRGYLVMLVLEYVAVPPCQTGGLSSPPRAWAWLPFDKRGGENALRALACSGASMRSLQYEETIIRTIVLLWCRSYMHDTIVLLWCRSYMHGTIVLLWCRSYMHGTIVLLWCRSYMHDAIVLLWCRSYMHDTNMTAALILSFHGHSVRSTNM